MTLAAEQRDLIAVIAAADRHGFRGKLRRGVILTDLGVAGMFLIAGPHRWQGNAYQPAQSVNRWIPEDWRFRVHGILLILLTIGIQYATCRGKRSLYHALSGIILTFYIWWALMFTYAALSDPRAGLLAPWVFGFLAYAHSLLVTSSRT